MKTLGYGVEDYKKFKKYAWIAVIGFSALYLFVYNGRLNMGLALPEMTKHFGWSKADAGILASVIFWTYGIGHLFSGRLGEIFGPKRFIFVGVILSVACNIFLSFQTSLIAIAVIWGINGFVQSFIWSPAMAFLAKWWPASKRGFASGMATGSAGVAQIVTWMFVLASFSWIPSMGWAAAFRIPVLFLLVVAVLFYIIVKDKPSDVGLKDYEDDNKVEAAKEAHNFKELEGKGKLYPYFALLKNWRFLCWCMIIAFSSIGRYGLLTWIPTYYVDVMKMKVTTGIFSSVVLPIGMALGSFLVPWATDRFSKGNRLPAVIICSGVAAVSVFIFPSLTNVTAAGIGLFIAGFFVYAITGVVWAYSLDAGSRAFAGTAAGILDFAAYMGAALQAIIFGGVLNATNNWNIVFFTIATMLAAILVFALIAGRKKTTVSTVPSASSKTDAE